MSNILFILGAGASKSCNAPLMYDFIDTASRLIAGKTNLSYLNDFNLVFDTISKLQQVHSKAQLDISNIESVFTTFEIGKILNKLPGVDSRNIDNIIRALKVLIYKTLEEVMYFPVKGQYIYAQESYNNFSKLIKWLIQDANPKNKVDVISFNYDIGIDMGLFRNGLGPYYGFPSEDNSNKVSLFKLHGSLNWGQKCTDKSVLPLHLRDYFQVYSFNGFDDYSKCTLPISTHQVEYWSKKNVEIESVPVIVPPSWNKSEYQSQITNIWEKAAIALENADCIYIIGYSMPETDAFFKLLFALGTVGKTLLKRIVVINSDNSGEVEARFKKLLGPGAISRFEYIPKTFEESIKLIEKHYT
jgi:hypothetical protein